MLNSNTVFKINFSEKENKTINNQIETFCDGMGAKGQSLDHWANTRKTNKEKATKDNYLGKKAEEIVARFFYEYHDKIKEKTGLSFPWISPDYTIYSRNDTGSAKSWDSDLPYSKNDPKLPNVHVKSCDDNTLRLADNQMSWCFSLDPKDHLLKFPNPKELVVCVFTPDKFKEYGEVRVIIPANAFQKYLKPPVRSKHKDTKRFIYWNDIKNKPLPL